MAYKKEFGNRTEYYNDAGKLHREDGPAIIGENGHVEWYLDGVRHRNGGPAVENISLIKEEWHYYGQLHRENGPARTYYDGGTEWRIGGKLHREDGPAIELSNGSYAWYKWNQLHREDGPAMEHASGICAWYLNGEEVNPEDLPCDYEYLKLKYGL